MIKSYALYTESNIDWLGDIPESWKLVKLKHFAKVSFSSVDRHEKEDEIRVNICHYPDAYKNDKIDFETQLSKGTCSQMQFENFQLKEGQVVITKDSESANDIGIPTYINKTFEAAVCGYHLAQITVNEKKLIGKFLFRYLQTKNVNYFFETNANGVTRFGLGKKTIQNLVLPLPTIFEQTKIALYLDHQTGLIDTIIEKKQQLIEKLKEQRQAIINEAVTKGLDPNTPMKNSGVEWLGEIPEHWKVVKLKWISEIYAGGTPSKNINKYWENGTIPWLNSGSVNDKRISNPSTYITEEALSNSSAKWIRKGALVMALAGQGKTKGTVALLEIDTTCNQSMAAIDLDQKIVDNEFIYYWLESNYYRIRGLAGTEQRDGLNLQIIGNIFCPIPPIQEQSAISQKINEKATKIDQLQSNIIFQIKMLVRFRQSIISEAVTGKIDVREWEPKTA